MTDIGLLVRSANPVPDDSQVLTDDELGAVLLLAEQRSTDMDTRERESTTAEGSPRAPGWIIAAAAFGVVVIVVGAVWLLAGSDAEAPPATSPPSTTTAPEATAPTTTQPEAAATATTIASTATPAPGPDAEAVAFVEALVADIDEGDHASAGARLEAVDQINKNGYVPGVEEDDWTTFFQGMFEYWTLVDSTLRLEECNTSDFSGVTRCLLMRASSETVPTADEELVITLRLEDGRLAYYEQGPVPLSQYWLDFRAFDEWLYDTTYSDDTSIYNAWFSYAAPAERVAIDREYGALWVEDGRPSGG
jgi:hypothetical protein